MTSLLPAASELPPSPCWDVLSVDRPVIPIEGEAESSPRDRDILGVGALVGCLSAAVATDTLLEGMVDIDVCEVDVQEDEEEADSR